MHFVNRQPQALRMIVAGYDRSGDLRRVKDPFAYQPQMGDHFVEKAPGGKEA